MTWGDELNPTVLIQGATDYKLKASSNWNQSIYYGGAKFRVMNLWLYQIVLIIIKDF